MIYSQATAQRYSVLFQNAAPSVRAEFTDFILSKLCAAERESLSHLLQEARYAGFKVGGDRTDFALLLQALGFTVTEVPRGRTIHNYVSV